MNRQPLPVQAAIEALGDSSADHNDGDNSGYYSISYDAPSGLLNVCYEADADAPNCSMTAVFRLIGATSADDA